MPTYGTVEYLPDTNKWKIECDPNVMIRLKRVFGKVDTKSFGHVKITASDENCRDLEWFLERYPMKLKDSSRLIRGARQYDQGIIEATNILEGNFTYEGSEMALPARDYQKQAAALAHRVGGLLVADDLGLGKTITGITTFAIPEARPALVVCPTHLQLQWQREVGRFLPEAHSHIIKTRKTYELALPDGRLPDVIIVTYSKLAGWAEHFSGFAQSVVFDECQELRRAESQKYRAAKHVAKEAAYRLGLSATPIYNYGDEFYNVLSVMSPNKMGSLDEFKREWCTDLYGRSPKIKDPKAFGKYLRTNAFMVRRTRKEVMRELPNLNRIVHTVESDVKALEDIEQGATELAKIILDQSGAAKGIDKLQSSSELSNTLRQATGIAKAPYVAEFVKMLLESGEPVVLFGWHRAVYDIWAEKFEKYNPAWYTGAEQGKKKDAEAKRFLDGETPLLIMSLRSGSGLDGLQKRCKTVVIGELDWSPGAIEQCIGRVHRDGQDEKTFVYYLTADEGADPIMTDVLGLKRKQIDPVKDPEGSLVLSSEIDPNHIKKLAKEYLRGLKKC